MNVMASEPDLGSGDRHAMDRNAAPAAVPATLKVLFGEGAGTTPRWLSAHFSQKWMKLDPCSAPFPQWEK
jgi:hypothetical protein